MDVIVSVPASVSMNEHNYRRILPHRRILNDFLQVGHEEPGDPRRIIKELRFRQGETKT